MFAPKPLPVGSRSSEITAGDPRWASPQFVEIVAQGVDLGLTGVGGGPSPGDLGYLGLTVPLLPTVDNIGNRRSRYLFRLGGIEIPANCGLTVLDIRQYATIGTLVAGTVPGPDADGVPGPVSTIIPVNLPVTTPSWRFSDGANIAWFLRKEQNRYTASAYSKAGSPPSSAPGFDTLSSAILCEGVDGDGAPISPNGGVPPSAGVGVGALGEFHEMRFPYQGSSSWGLNYYVSGPGNLIFYASVFQTNPVTRPDPTSYSDRQFLSLCPEDQFVASYPRGGLEAPPGPVFTRIGGAMTVALMPEGRDYGPNLPAPSLTQLMDARPRDPRRAVATASLVSLMPSGPKRGRRPGT